MWATLAGEFFLKNPLLRAVTTMSSTKEGINIILLLINSPNSCIYNPNPWIHKEKNMSMEYDPCK